MPRDDGVRLDDDQRRSPVGPDATEPCPEESIGRGQPRSLHRALQDAHLVTQCEDLELQGRAAAERLHERRANGEEHVVEWESMEEAQLQVYQSDRDLREPQVDYALWHHSSVERREKSQCAYAHTFA